MIGHIMNYGENEAGEPHCASIGVITLCESTVLHRIYWSM